jgi:hypothetical protein
MYKLDSFNMRHVITLLLLFIGFGVFAQGNFTRMSQQYFYTKSQKFGGVLLLDTAMFGAVNMNNPNLYVKIDTTGMAASGSVKLVLDTVATGGAGQDVRVDSINTVLQSNKVVERTLFEAVNGCENMVFDKNYFHTEDGINPCNTNTIQLLTDDYIAGNKAQMVHNSSNIPSLTGVDEIIQIGTYTTSTNNLIEVTIINEGKALVVYIK